LVDLIEKKSAKVGTIVIGIGETIYRTADGHKVGTYISRGIRIPPPAPRERRLYEPREPYHYTQEELNAIEEEILAQQRRGSKIRYWEDVNIGDRVLACVKGPLDFPTMACFHAGLGPIGYASADIAVKRRHAVPQTSASLPYSIAPETAPTRSPASADGHDDPNVAQAAGMPGAFDIGWQRISWMIQGLTDWAGDTGRLQMIDVRLVSPNVIGDTTWCHATVTQKRIAGAMHAVDLKAEAERQDREISAVGTATVVLPSRSASVRSIDRID
jgi:hypothetical protein